MMKKSGLSDRALCGAVQEMARGLIDADLGGGVIKKRIALPGGGKSGGARTLLATNRQDRWFFIFGFKKNERANITDEELDVLKLMTADLLSLTNAQLAHALEQEELLEICHDD